MEDNSKLRFYTHHALLFCFYCSWYNLQMVIFGYAYIL